MSDKPKWVSLDTLDESAFASEKSKPRRFAAPRFGKLPLLVGIGGALLIGASVAGVVVHRSGVLASGGNGQAESPVVITAPPVPPVPTDTPTPTVTAPSPDATAPSPGVTHAPVAPEIPLEVSNAFLLGTWVCVADGDSEEMIFSPIYWESDGFTTTWHITDEIGRSGNPMVELTSVPDADFGDMPLWLDFNILSRDEVEIISMFTASSLATMGFNSWESLLASQGMTWDEFLDVALMSCTRKQTLLSFQIN